MTKEEITRMAREAGILEPIELLESNQWRQDTIRELERFFQAAYAAGAAAEREEILTYAKSEAFNRMHGERSPYAHELVNYISARGQT